MATATADMISLSAKNTNLRAVTWTDLTYRGDVTESCGQGQFALHTYYGQHYVL